ncbi:hypothetical protein K523DRAFT_323730 [Schizophyllum commune Tattone D]|nr:hypothetical protein K523DRAFT_323730 [Schizophyllum commune Tattone D]
MDRLQMTLLLEIRCTTYEGCIDGIVVRMNESAVCLFDMRDAEIIEEDVFAMS